MNNLIDVSCPMFLSIKDAARKTGLSEYFFRENLKAGKIPHMKSGKKIYVDMVQLSAALESMTENSMTE